MQPEWEPHIEPGAALLGDGDGWLCCEGVTNVDGGVDQFLNQRSGGFGSRLSIGDGEQGRNIGRADSHGESSVGCFRKAHIEQSEPVAR
jgi:hypothetical protein